MAKTLWILLSGNKKGFDGVYRYDDSSIALNVMPQFRGTHLVEMEELLMQATSYSPDDRPTMESFRQSILNWQEISKNDIKKSQSNWHFLLRRLFGNNNAPSECTWYSVDEIVHVLKEVNRLPISRYMFFPNGGDLDFSNVEKATEDGCMDIISDLGFFRVKPKRLIFEKFEVSAWNYFLLELSEQNVAVGDCYDEYTEEVVEDTQAHLLKEPYFKAEIKLIAKPSHLFTRDEIEAEMRAADDRKDNVLVISIDGYAHVVPSSQNTSLYPVVHETWCAGNNYVGRYSKLTDLDSTYHYCLAKWYDYLTRGCEQPMEEYDGCSLSVKELIENIEKI